MNQVKHFGPALVLAAVGLVALFVGPRMVRQLAYAEQQGRIAESYDRLKSGPLMELNEAFRSVGRVVEPSVAHISVRRKPVARDNRGRPQPFSPLEEYDDYNVPQEAGNGSGWVYLHSNGKNYVITNNHVIEEADELVVKFFDKTTAKATVVGRDSRTDIAVLQVNEAKSKQLHPAKLADQPVQRGEVVFAFGSPFAFDFSMSQGIVSADGRRLGILDKWSLDGRLIESGYENFIQTDAAINPGNSGGPLTNVYGEVVGMSSAIATRTGGSNGLGFAIPVDMIHRIADQLIEKGVVHRGHLGVWIADLDEKMAGSFGYNGRGVLVNDLVGEDSPAGKAGVKPDDIIMEINGKPVSNMSDLRHLVADVPPGDTLKMKVFRGGGEHLFDVKVIEQPEEGVKLSGGAAPGQPDPSQADGPRVESLKKLGLEKLSTFTQKIADQARMEFTPGVLVESVRPNSAAAAERLRPGGVITHVQGVEVKDLEAFAAELAKHSLKEGVRFRVRTGDSSRSVLLALPDGSN